MDKQAVFVLSDDGPLSTGPFVNMNWSGPLRIEAHVFLVGGHAIGFGSHTMHGHFHVIDFGVPGPAVVFVAAIFGLRQLNRIRSVFTVGVAVDIQDHHSQAVAQIERIGFHAEQAGCTSGEGTSFHLSACKSV